MSPQFTHPLQYRLPAFSDPWIADPRVLLDGTLFPYRCHAHALSVFLKLQSVSGPYPEPPPHFPRYGDLPLARDLRLFLHRRTPISLLYHSFLTFVRPPRARAFGLNAAGFDLSPANLPVASFCPHFATAPPVSPQVFPKVFLDVPLSTGIIDPVGNSMWSAGARSRFSFCGARFSPSARPQHRK